ncbi:hypothetical protein METBIDRAFT_47549 [Metschnikowia bicuspidata var. bicuspidata NRRL YB-4993]|uniref:RGS domain-containing protein n=1 Tax=Metschnikowia bicuspidata var. bicuspidata NRRL YB-4993 TaxID=869754 RepID=A0A1A0H4W3_9ASCO|nr:hypothetical protein METBIDRAFT_47549 [Metschnikowia bicuspidata var. bicuspidata NRRL YB-4993]OBA19076.1 hypothetical protein METBIDRAFT_47549 [Metschnikowia bicuspidata var. bicuspidata NRRL YB-4993]
MTEKYQLDNPNAHYLANLSNLNLTNNNIQLGRLPTLGEILSNKTKSPISLYNFYLYMKNVENNADYLDFWFDLINHLNLCKHYVQGLRESLVRQSVHSNNFGSNNPFNSSPNHNRDSFPLSEKSKYKSLSLSVLLELILNDQILEDNDSNRLSQFLRGEINLDTVDPKLKELIEAYNAEESIAQPSPTMDRNSFYTSSDRQFSSQSRLLDEPVESPQISPIQQGDFRPPDVLSQNDRIRKPRRHSSLNPSLLENLIKDSPVSNLFISRQNLRESSHNLLLKYFVEDSEKSLEISPHLNDKIVKAIQIDGRDDPSVFDGVKLYVFDRLENEHLPNFLNFIAIKNINRSVNARVIFGFFMSFISFWIAFSLIFLDEKKRYRCVIIFTFFCGFYGLMTSIYRIDPLLAFSARSESYIPSHTFIRVEDTFIHKLLMKRATWVLFLVLLLTAIFSVPFCLVPGKHL